MSTEIEVLRALLRLARRRLAASEEALVARVPRTRSEIRASLRRLRSYGLVGADRVDESRLTLEGLALSVALAKRPAKVERPALLRCSRAA